MPFGIAWHTVVLFFGLVAFTPTRLGDLHSHPMPVADYTTALKRITALQVREDSIVAPGGGSILLTHGHRTARVIVLFHGLTDSPLQYFPFAQRLFAEGDNVFVPRLPHHAERSGHVGSLGKLTAQELRDLGDESVDVARGLGDTVIVSGLSAGGTVAAWVAQYRSDVDRVVLVAPALEVTHVPSLLHGAVLRIALRVPNVTRASPRDSTEPDREPGWATHAVAQTLELGAAVRSAAGQRAAAVHDVTVLLNAYDRTISNGAAIDLARRWQSRGAVTHIYELPDSLRLPHDVIDPRHPGSNTEAVYPVLDALIVGSKPPEWVGALK
ncbi:MAG TPA: alpha/beta hydrolase [Gemmatimonadaceae bacterium]|jgi:alpha-beta hydrolase superfamily lysophospholipase